MEQKGIQRIPTNYILPNFKFKNAWSYWLFGDVSNNLPPLQYIGTWELPKSERTKFRNYRRVMQRVEISVKRKYPHINFKRDFPLAVSMSTEKVELANTYFNEGKNIVGPTKKRKYKSQPVSLMGISSVVKRFVKLRTNSAPAVAIATVSNM